MDKQHNDLEKVVKWALGLGFSTGHADNLDMLLEEIGWQVKELRERGRKESYQTDRVDK